MWGEEDSTVKEIKSMCGCGLFRTNEECYNCNPAWNPHHVPIAKNVAARPSANAVITNIEEPSYNGEIDTKAPLSTDYLILHKDEVVILTRHLRNEYLTHHEPERSLLLKIYQFAERNK